MQNISESDFNGEVLNSDMPVLVDFWAEWCAPCRALMPTLEQVATEYQGRVKVCKVNIDTDGNLANNFGVMTIPTLIVFKNGEEVDRNVGSVSKNVLSSILDKHI